MNVPCGGEGDRITHAVVHVLDLQVRIEVVDDPVKWDGLIDQLKDAQHGDPGPGSIAICF